MDQRWGWGDWLVLALLVLTVLALALGDDGTHGWTVRNFR